MSLPVPPIEDQFPRFHPSSIFEDLDLHAVAINCPKPLGELHFCVAAVVVMNKPSEKTNDHCRGGFVVS
jgi:hypothetical protein